MLAKILFLLSLINCSLHLTAQSCSDVDYGKACPLVNSPETVKIVGDQLFIGTAGVLQVFSLDLQHSTTVNLSSTEDTVADCVGIGQGQFGVNPEDCKNFIRTISIFPADVGEDRVMVCGTNAYHPLCRLHNREQPSSFDKLSGPDEIDEGFSPHSNTRSVVALLASNNRFFSATRFDGLDARPAIRMSPGLLNEPKDTDFTVGTPLSDPRWLNEPTFVSVHEYGEHVYFFITEEAFEVSSAFQSVPQSMQEVIYARAIRVCKTDDGINAGTDPEDNHFLTFEKARMECSVTGNGGSIPFFYNEIKSTYLSQSENGSPILYGVFNSPINGPPGGAICKFSFDPAVSGSITKVFRDTDYLVRQDNGADLTWMREVGSPFSCPNSQGVDPQRTVEDSESFQLKFDPITPSQESPVLVSSGQFLDKIAVEIVTFEGESQEVVYYTNQQGDIKQVASSSTGTFEHTLYASDVADPIRDLVLHPGTDSSTLFASTSNRILQIPRGQCSNYDSCFDCFDSGDVYCGWDTVQKACKSKFTNSDLIESFSASETQITSACGTRPLTPTPEPVLPCDSQIPSTSPDKVEVTTNTGGEDCATTKDVLGPIGLQTDEGGISIGVIVGATLAAFVLGVPIGGVVCLIFYRRFSSSKSNKAEKPSPEAPREPEPQVSTRIENNITDATSAPVVNNNHIKDVQTETVQTAEKKDVTTCNLDPPPPPRYVQTNPISTTNQPNGIQPQNKVPLTHIPPVTTQANGTPSTILPSHKYSNNRNLNRTMSHQFPEEVEEDSAFVEKDTLPPLKNFSPGTMYGSLGRHKTGSNGVTRKQVPGHKVPRGRSDSTTWLRQRSESLSSDISFSSNTSPLQSPISDV